MVTKSKKSAKLVRLNGSPLKAKPRTVYKFNKHGRNCGPLLPSEKRDRRSYDYSDEM
ncbi:MAG: hypothetical protein ACREV9_15385 [Burkholderiales bacterium]